MRTRPLAIVPVLSFVAAAFAWPGTASALDFTPSGDLQFAADAVIKEGFETLTLSNLTTRESAEALEGKRVAFINAQSFDAAVTIPLALPKEDAAYKARMFIRKNRILAEIDVQGGTLSEVGARFYPTGRVTSDGWFEVETAAFTVQGAQGATASAFIYASGTEVDGFEVVPVGPARTLRACSGADDPVCGTGEFCAARSCHDGALGLPPLPNASFRVSIVDYLKKRFELFFGGRYTRLMQLPVALATMEEMKHATDSWTFWNGFATAIRRLRDWHTKIDASVTVAGRGSLPVCFVEGDADLSRAVAPSALGYPDVLVSHVGPTENFGLKPGDRLVAVDGMHPIAFMEALETINWDTWRSNDPRGHAEKLESIRKAIRRWAKSFTIVRCDGAHGTCGNPETYDVSALSDTEPEIYPTCDHRPAYHLASGNPDPVTHEIGDIYVGPLANTQPHEGLYGMIWDSVYLDGSATNPYEAPMQTLSANANGVVLDHRTGNGGTVLAAEYLTQLFRTQAFVGAGTGFNFTLGQWDAPTPKYLLDMFNLHKQDQGEAYSVGSSKPKPNLRAALLLARDGSASDWFPLGMRGAADVRLFGRRTAGAFSSYLTYDYFGFLSFRVASGDFISPDGATHIGYGVEPDEDLLPKQSDLIVGRDTVYERALSWVKTGH